MSSAELTKSARIRAPYGDGTANTNVRLFSGGVLATETTHKATVLPQSWHGQWLTIRAIGGNCWVMISPTAAEIDRTVAASEAGAASPKLGIMVPSGEAIPFEVPSTPIDATDLYLCRESDAVGTKLEVWLSS